MKKNLFFIIYSIILIMFVIYVLLDAFVIPQTLIVVEPNVEETTTSNSVEEAKITNSTYEDDNISINITTLRKYDTDIYVVDIELSNIEYLKTAFANNTYGKNITEKTSTIAKEHNAILAINGDYYGFRTTGIVLRNGVLYRNTSSSENALVIYSDGNMEAVSGSVAADTLLENNAIQTFSFGPVLVNDSKIVVDVNDEVDQSMTSNPRTAIGMIEPLHYIVIVSDGRTSESEGLTLYELAEVFESLNCTVAYNLDGGGSSTLYFNGEIINNPTTNGKTIKEREVSDIVYIGY